MKKLILIPLLLFGLFLIHAQTITALEDSLSQTPTPDARYSETLVKLEQTAAQGVRNADLFHDIGVCQFHLGERGKAVLWFLRALNLDSAHKASRQNLEYIESNQPSEQEEAHEPYLAQLFLSIWNFFSLNRLAIVVLIWRCSPLSACTCFSFIRPKKSAACRFWRS